MHLLLNRLEVSNCIEKLCIGQLLLVECIGYVVPKFKNVAGRHWPQLKRVIANNIPTRVQTDQVVIVNLPFNNIAPISFFELIDEISLFIIKFSIKLLFDDINDGRIVELIRALR